VRRQPVRGTRAQFTRLRRQRPNSTIEEMIATLLRRRRSATSPAKTGFAMLEGPPPPCHLRRISTTSYRATGPWGVCGVPCRSHYRDVGHAISVRPPPSVGSHGCPLRAERHRPPNRSNMWWSESPTWKARRQAGESAGSNLQADPLGPASSLLVAVTSPRDATSPGRLPFVGYRVQSSRTSMAAAVWRRGGGSGLTRGCREVQTTSPS